MQLFSSYLSAGFENFNKVLNGFIALFFPYRYQLTKYHPQNHHRYPCDEIVAQPVRQLGGTIVPQVVRQIQTPVNQYNIKPGQLISRLVSIPWGHNVCIIEKIKDLKQAFFF